jgi:hypothetical protein
MMLSTREILLEYVSPLLGAIFANLMFAAPLKDVRTAVQNGSLGHLNPTPWAVMTGNTIGWITYSYLLNVRMCVPYSCRRRYSSDTTFMQTELLYLLRQCTWLCIFHLAQHGSGETSILR